MTGERQPGTCSWCGLPVAGGWFQSRTSPPDSAQPSLSDTAAIPSDAVSSDTLDDGEFCCFGCRFAAQVTQDRGESGQVQWTLTRLGIAIFFTMNVMVFTMALWSQDVYELDSNDAFTATLSALFRWMCFLASMPVLFLLCVPIAVSAVSELSRSRITTDLLVTVGVVAAFGYSLFSLLNNGGHVYFEVASMVLVLVTLGRWLEARSKQQAGELLDSLQSLLPDHALLVTDSGERSISVTEIKPGDLVRVLAGERVPADGILEFAGSAGSCDSTQDKAAVSVDQQVLTGENVPVVRWPGDEIVSGTVPVDSGITIRVTRAAEDGALSRILSSVRQARAQRGRFQRMADQVTSWFVPFVGVVTVLTFVGHSLSGSAADGILAALAVTLIACPCALGLATSVAVWAAMRRAADQGVLFRSGETLEQLSTIRAVRFDKTGTLTTGRPRLAAMIPANGQAEADVRGIALAMTAQSTHGFSQAICRALRLADDSTADSMCGIQNVRTVSGLGLEGELTGASSQIQVWLGSQRFLESQDCAFPPELDHAVIEAGESGRSVVLLGWDELVRAAFTLEEDLRDESHVSVDQCRDLGLDCGILSGDLSIHAKRLGNRLGIPASGELLPEDKLSALSSVRQDIGPVLMIGDGINDGPALAGADVAASLASGTDLSRDAAGVCLLRDDLRNVPWMIRLARQTRRVIRQNLAWAFGYNTVGMAFAATGNLSPVLAAILMFGSSAFVLWNSRRLSWFETEHPTISATKEPADHPSSLTDSVSQAVQA